MVHGTELVWGASCLARGKKPILSSNSNFSNYYLSTKLVISIVKTSKSLNNPTYVSLFQFFPSGLARKSLMLKESKDNHRDNKERLKSG